MARGWHQPPAFPTLDPQLHFTSTSPALPPQNRVSTPPHLPFYPFRAITDPVARGSKPFDFQSRAFTWSRSRPCFDTQSRPQHHPSVSCIRLATTAFSPFTPPTPWRGPPLPRAGRVHPLRRSMEPTTSPIHLAAAQVGLLPSASTRTTACRRQSAPGPRAT